MSTLLPKLRKTHIESNIMLTGRQEKILAILRGDKLSPQLNDVSSRKFFRKGSDMSSAGADLAAVHSSRFAAGNAFMTGLQTPERSRRIGESTMETNFKRRQGSINPSAPSLDFQSGHGDANKSRFMNKTIDPPVPGGKSMNSAQVTLSNQKILGNKDGSIQNLQIPADTLQAPREPSINIGNADDFANMHSLSNLPR